ncbi:MAG: type II secretion system F family protein [Armatimonadota bacterium]|jgi:type II secretory pathway component PulF|nr:type II secretion system F family protein [Armatimonadota bacterium]MDT7972259.1 type II secretion system F family protein [Armatimonadota bacterium]
MATVTPTRVATVPSRRRRRVSFQDLTVMTRQLASLVGGGLTLMQSIDALIEHTENERLASALMQIREELRGGGTFAEALTKHPHLFSPLYVSIVRAGEVSGELPRVLNWLADYMEREQTRRTQIRSALAYPILLSIVMVIALSFLLIFLVPRYAALFAEMGQSLPLPTQILLAVSGFLVRWWWAIGSGIVAIVYAYRLVRRTPRGRWVTDAWKLRLPVFGRLHLKSAVGRMARALSVLLMGGVSVLEALAVVRDVVGNEVLAQALDEVRQRVREGERLADHLRRSGVFPPLLTRLAAVGEETGSLPQALTTVADTLDLEVDSSLKALVALLEPALILSLGIVVGFVVISLLMAVFQLNALVR